MDKATRRKAARKDPLSRRAPKLEELAKRDPGELAREVLYHAEHLARRAQILAEMVRGRRSALVLRPMTQRERAER